LLEVFFKLHDPTTLNQQGADFGSQYRSAIFFHDDVQKAVAFNVLNKVQNEYKNKIVTEITQFKNFYEADSYHRDFYFKNRGNVYCMLVIDPKINKLKKDFKEILA
jgi:peptide-methionine (S)-S-oxide reductase